jgi:lysophospholipase L1-like esterase
VKHLLPALAPGPILALAVGSLLAAPTAAQFNIACFGDSITEGHPTFDESADENDPPEEWGYPRRLDDALGSCGTSSCAVYNRGLSAEDTPEGLTRLQNQVLPERRWDLLLLMEGTNDIFKHVSTTTIQANLRLMDQRATEAGVDTLHASIIHFHPDALTAPPANRPWLNADAATLRDQIFTITTQRKRYFSDQFNVLCPAGGGQAACFSNHYGETDIVGHPDASGFDLMAAAFEGAVTSVPVPGTPSTVSPGTTTCGAPSTFTWNKESPARANWYNLLIENSGGSDLASRWYQETEWRAGQPNPCNGASQCSVPAPIALTAGSYRWSVRGRNPAGHGAFTATRAFSVVTVPPPTVTTLSAPAGSTANNQPTYTWSTSTGATGYELGVETAAGAPVLTQSFTTSICGGGSCNATPAGTLAPGDYRWRVRSSNPCQADWSGYQTFHVWGPAGAALPITPADGGDIVLAEPGFYWSAASEADEYEIELEQEGGGTLVLNPAPPFAAASACTGSGCSVSAVSPTLSPGNYAWRVRASNPLGDGPWSDLAAFSVLACDATDPLVLENDTLATSESLLVCTGVEVGNQGAGDYVVATGGHLTLHVGHAAIFFAGFQVAGGGALTVRTDRP